jgi:cystathionine beta-lyase/cystathionine gamma-synthase
MRLETQLVHAGEPRPRIAGAVTMPIFQSSTFLYGGEGGYHDVRYIRLSNTPNHLALNDKLTALEGGEAAIVTASGMAAISTAILAVAGAGDHILVGDSLYGGTHDLVTKDLAHLGISHDVIDPADPSSWAAKIKPRTKLVYVETITNPLLRVGDLAAVAAFARAHDLVSMIDNTFASPVNFRPIAHGFDLVAHSCTKYLNGHNDVVAGAVIGRSAALVDKVKHRMDHLGGTLDPHACFLLHRGLKTLALRVRAQNESALRLARLLAESKSVAHAHYPGLPSHADHDRARALLTGFGGMVSFELHGGMPAAKKFLERLTIPLVAPSLGGPETLITLPSTTSHAGLSPAQRQAAGISESLIRVSVGIESIDDLLADFEQAIKQ